MIIEGRLLIGPGWEDGQDREEVRNPADHKLLGRVVRAQPAQVDRAVQAAASAMATPFPAHLRYRVLMDAADRLEADAAEVAYKIAAEGSKTIREARREPPRAAEILRLSADAARRIQGQTLPFDIKPGSENRRGYFSRIPVGVVAAILPFNDPLAVAAHKLGPALASGNAVVMKPDSRTPFAPLHLAQVLCDAGLPPGRLNVLTGTGREVGAPLTAHPLVRLVSFTGGLGTGKLIARQAGVKKLILELGSNSAVIVLDDADLERAAEAIVAGAFAQAGQNCLGVQRVYVESSSYRALKERVVAKTEALRTGHALDEQTDVCTMISEQEAQRVEEWISEAVSGGAKALTGGVRTGATVQPTVLEGVPTGVRMDCDEVYGPVVTLQAVEDLDEAIVRTNSVPYGLHAAIFTSSIASAFRAADELQVGGVMINDSTDYRLDTMPFGGIKGSGIGREGIDAAVQSMTEERVVCFNL